MHELLNILYVFTQGAVLHLDEETVRVVIDGKTRLRVPLLRLGGVVVAGQVTLTPFLIQRCARDGRMITWLDRNGRFGARIEGPATGNVLLRRAQHLALSDEARRADIARQFVAGKVQNTRLVLLRAAREAVNSVDREPLAAAATHLEGSLQHLRQTDILDEIRGIEGEAARTYFGVFGFMVRGDRAQFLFEGRTRRPPRDRANAVLSFLYALLRSECASAAEGAGLDPQVGYLHALRPGRPALALDLMEELRPALAERLALTLINRKQLTARDFEQTAGGAVLLSDNGRRTVVAAFQQRKEEMVNHRVLQRKIPIGLIPHVQARLLARHLRGDLSHYLPFLAR